MLARRSTFIRSAALLAALLVGCAPNTPTAAPATSPAEVVSPTEAVAPTDAPAAATEATTASGPATEKVLNYANINNSFTPNFNPFTGVNALVPTVKGIFEPLMIYNTLKAEMVPWLADSYAWSDDYLTVTFKLHPGIKWSDGEDFTSEDVVFTFNLIKNTPGLQGSGATAMGGAVDSVSAPDAGTVVFTLKAVNTESIYDIVNQDIVPEHIWKDVADPAKFPNEDPVGTGPFTEVVDFQPQVYQVDKNPNYWQPGLPKFNGFRVTAYSGNEAQIAAWVQGQIDYAGTVMPNIDEAVVANNPEISYVYPPANQTVILNLNTTLKPFDDPIVRKAMSMALDREQMVAVAFNGKAVPGDVTGLSDAFSAWKVKDVSSLGDWTTYNSEKAAQMLEDAGYKLGADGVRTSPDGTPMSFKLTMVQGFTDWISAGEIMVQNWKDIGVNVETNMIDAGAFFGSFPMGDYQIALWFGWPSPTPYTQYMNTMSTLTVAPAGQFSMTNFAKFGSAKADELLAKFAGTADDAEKKQAGYDLQALFAEQAPVIPLWAGNDWAIYNNAHFTGWPTKENNYSYGFPNGGNTPEWLIVLTTISAK